MKKSLMVFCIMSALTFLSGAVANAAGIGNLTYPIVSTGVTQFYSDTQYINQPKRGEPFYGQNANYRGRKPSYKDNGDGTVTDKVTGLVWQKKMIGPMTLEEAQKAAKSCKDGGKRDWRVPTVKELYSLIQYTGHSMGQRADVMFIDTRYFEQPLGSPREIDAQTWSCTRCKAKTMRGESSIFGVNFIDGRIKSYAVARMRTPGEPNRMYFRLVRGNPQYGKNRFKDNGDGTITDKATGLMWGKEDSKTGMDWQHALEWAENLKLAGFSDWRLPDVKELQSIVDYDRSPDTDRSPAIDPMFMCTEVETDGSRPEFGYYWSSTTHEDGPQRAANACYVSFGRALGQMRGELMDVHGAGAQRSDPKSARQGQFPQYRGPQGDLRRVNNLVRPVRTVN